MSGRAAGANRGVGAVRGMFMFLLLAAFAVLSVIVVLVGARVYRAVEGRGAENYESRTVLAYVAGKVRALDAAGRITTETVGGADALVLGAAYGGEDYATYIYAYDGRLMEYFGRAGSAFSPEHGEPIAEAAGFDAVIERGLLTVTVARADGGEDSLTLYLQCGEAGA